MQPVRAQKCGNARLHRGFTLIEMLVAVSIIIGISSIIIFQYAKFDSHLLLRNLAYEIALSIREAQVLGVSVRGMGADDLSRFQRSYGVHFELADNKKYRIFRDNDNDGIYDGEPTDTVLSTFTIGRGNKLTELCAGATAGSGCSTLATAKLDILFQRPNPDAYIHKDGSAATDWSAARIAVSSERDASSVRYVEITAPGQISVQ